MNEILVRTLAGQTLENGKVLLDAIRFDLCDGQPAVRLFLSGVRDAFSATGSTQRTVQMGDDCILDIELTNPDTDSMIVAVGDNEFQCTADAHENHLSAGKNAAILHRNGESLEHLAQALALLERWHTLQVAVVVERAPPQAAEKNRLDLQKALEDLDVSGLTVVLLHAPVPLGLPGLGPERHAFHAPDAPGKDRMTPPEPDPWRAQIAVPSIYELVRTRFLSEARAVLNLEAYDLLGPPVSRGGTPGQVGTVFDLAQACPEAAVTLSGRRVFPWGVASGRTPTFGDHTCWRFDSDRIHQRWCADPKRMPPDALWRQTRISGLGRSGSGPMFWRCMALRHGVDDKGVPVQVSRLVPKSSLVECAPLVRLVDTMGARPKRVPGVALKPQPRDGPVVIVSTMKNEGPFILEWIAYHRSIGVDDFLVYTNDCDDGTDRLLDVLQLKGFLTHRDNPYRDVNLKPQHAALAAAEAESLVQNAAWLICMDVDEFINVHAGAGHLSDLFGAVPDANMISMTWRLFGNSDIDAFTETFITENFTRCAPQMARKPHQAWGFKTLYRNLGIFRKMGVHRPKGLQPQLLDHLRWVNGSGASMPRSDFRNAWRSTTKTVGYDLVTLNHYAVRSAESFLVKRDRGRVNHVDRDQGSAYWFRMNNNSQTDTSIRRMLPGAREEFDQLLADPQIAQAHADCVDAHRKKISALKATSAYSDFHQEITSERMKALSRLHGHFGSSVFLSGPDVIPDDVWQGPLEKDYFLVVGNKKP